MNDEGFYQYFCAVMRRQGEVKLKNIAAAANVSLPEARKSLNRLVKKGKIKKIGAGRSTAYTFL